jgi:hypothetical protein
VLVLCLLVSLSFVLSGALLEAVVVGTTSSLWFVSRLRILDDAGTGSLFLRRKALLEGVQMLCLGVLMLAAIAVTIAIVFLPWKHTAEGRLLDLALVGIVLLLKRELERHDEAFHRLHRGIDAEEAVADALSAVRDRGWEVVNGWPRESGGNLDHAVRGPNRVFAIETKSYRFPTNKDLSQAIRNAVWLKQQWNVDWVVPVVCVNQPGLDAVERFSGANGVWVVDRRTLSDWLVAMDATPRRTRRGSSSPRRRSPAPAAP